MKQQVSSRRDFLRTTGIAIPSLLMFPSLVRSAHRSSSPRLPLSIFFDESDLPRMRRQFADEEMFSNLRMRLASTDRVAERRFMREEVKYNDHLFDIPRLHNTAPAMSFYYLMTGDEDAAELAVESIRTMMKFPKWDYFLEAGKHVLGIQRASGAALAVALSADWLGTYISDEERSSWLKTMGEKGCEACFLSIYGMRYKDRVVGWSMDPESNYLEHRPGDIIDMSNWPTILDATNLKAVPAGALAVSALAYEVQFGQSADTTRWLEQAAYSIGTFKDLYETDGSYDEGVSYANYTSLHLIHGTHVLKRFGKADLADIINWPGYVDYCVGMTMPTNDDPFNIVNFGDNGNPKTGQAGSVVRSGAPLWIASKYGDSKAQWFATTYAGDYDEWGLIFYDESVPKAPPPPGPSIWRSELDWIVARTGYDADDFLVAMRSGGPSNHEHADRNSLVVKSHGEILIADPYRPPYSYSDPSWMMRTTAGHSAILIDGQGHQYHDGSEGTNASDAVSRIVRYGERERFFFWTSDATPAYSLVNKNITAVSRTVLFLPDIRASLVLDKIIATTPVTVEARYFADNTDGNGSIEGADNRFTMNRKAVSLLGVAGGSRSLSIRTGKLPIPADRSDLHPFVSIATDEKSNETFLITALLPLSEVEGSAEISSEGSVHTVVIRKGQATVTCRIFDTGTIPEYEIVS